MRVGKKPVVLEAKKTRSCVVRLENVTRNSTSPASYFQESPQQRITRHNRLSITAMAPTSKGRKEATRQQEEKPIKGSIKKRPGGSSLQTPQHQQKASTANISSIRSSQKIIPRSNKATPVSTPARDETPTPTIAAGRSRRAIKPNPKYASEDLVTPKVVRTLGLSATRGASSLQSGGNSGSKQRRISISSDDFYNRNSDDDFDNDSDDDDANADKAYQAYERESQEDSDYSEGEDVSRRKKGPRRRPKRFQETRGGAFTQQTTTKLPVQTPVLNIKRTNTTTTTNIRSAPSQLQQIRRSLATASTQRNINLLACSGAAQKRKLEETLDSSENESSFTPTRKQMLLTSAIGSKVNAPSTPITNKSRTMGTQKISGTPQQTVNGGSKVNIQISNTISRKIIEIPAKTSPEVSTKMSMRSLPNRQPQSTASSAINKPMTTKSAEQPRQQQQQTTTTHTKIFAAKNAPSVNRLRSSAPKPMTQKDTQSNTSYTPMQSSDNPSTQNVAPATKKLPTLNNSNKFGDKTKYLLPLTSKPNTASASIIPTATSAPTQDKTLNTNSKSTLSPPPAAAPTPAKTFPSDQSIEIQEDSPNSTMDDFETMPTFTIVNVNDIINKKGDVLITKSKFTNKQPTVIEFTESISLDDDDDDDDDVIALPPSRSVPPPSKTIKLPTLNNKQEFENKKSPLTRTSNESSRKTIATQSKNTAIFSSSTSSSTPAPQILNHQLGLRNSRVTPKTTTTVTLAAPDKPAPRILNSVVAKKTQPVKPMIANLDDSADESFPLSLDEDEEEVTEDEDENKPLSSNTIMSSNKKDLDSSLMEMDTDDTESQNTEEDDLMLQVTGALTPKYNTLPRPQRKKRAAGYFNAPIVVSSNKKRMTPAAAKENSLAATNQQINDVKSPTTTTLPRKNAAEKVVISKMGDKIIKKITCFETWYVINMPLEAKRQMVIKNQLEMPLIKLANNAKTIELPTDLWSSKVTLYELSTLTLAKSTLVAYTGDLTEHNIKEEDRGKYQPSCVMFRRSIDNRLSSRMPYDRAVIFKNKTFYTNIEGKNVRLIGAPSIINSEREIEILLEVVDTLTLQSEFVEHVSIVP